MMMRPSWLVLAGLALAGARRLTPTAPVKSEGFMKTLSKSVSIQPGPDGRLHRITRETQASKLGQGAEAEWQGVIKECRDGKCEEKEITDAKDVEKHLDAAWLPNLMGKRPFNMLLETPSLRDFALDDFASIGGFGRSLLDGAPLMTSPLLTSPLLRSRAAVQHDLKKPQDGAEEAGEKAEAQKTEAVTGDEIEDGVKVGDAKEAPNEEGANIKAAHVDAAAAAGPAKTTPKQASVTRTVIMTEKDGKREKTKIVERCLNGKCTKLVQKPDGEIERSESEQRHRTLAGV